MIESGIVAADQHDKSSKTGSSIPEGANFARPKLDITILLRDMLTPICIELESRVMALSDEEIRSQYLEIVNSPFKIGTDILGYPHHYKREQILGSLENDPVELRSDLSLVKKLLADANAPPREATDLSLSLEFHRTSSRWHNLLKDVEGAFYTVYHGYGPLKTFEGRLEKYRGELKRTVRVMTTICDLAEQELDDTAKADLKSHLYSTLVNAGGRAFSKPVMNLAVGEFEQTLWGSHEPIEEGGFDLRRFLTNPIGAQGERFAREAYATSLLMMDFAFESSREESCKLATRSPDLLKKTTRGRDRDASFETVVSRGMGEGVLTINQCLSLLLAEEVPGIKACNAEIGRLTPLVNQLARIVPPGVIGPVVQAGRFFPGLLVVRDGEPAIAASLQDHFLHHRKLLYAEQLGKDDAFTGHGCPLAIPMVPGEPTGIERVCRAFQRVHAIVSRCPRL